MISAKTIEAVKALLDSRYYLTMTAPTGKHADLPFSGDEINRQRYPKMVPLIRIKRDTLNT